MKNPMMNDVPGSTLQTSSAASKDSVAYSLIQRSLNEAGQGQLEFALVSCRQALLLAPQSFPAHSLHSMLLRRLARLEEALAASKTALAISPQNQPERARFTELRTALQNGHKECVVGVDQWQAFVREIEASTPVSALPVSPTPVSAANASPRSQPATISNRTLLAGGFVTFVLLLVFLTAREMRIAATTMAAGKAVNIQTPAESVGQIPAEAVPAQARSTPVEAGAPVAGTAGNETVPAAPETAQADSGTAPPASTPAAAPQNPAGTTYNTTPSQVAPRTPVPQSPMPQSPPVRRTIPAAPPRVYSVPDTPGAATENRNELTPRVPQPTTGEAVGPRFSNP